MVQYIITPWRSQRELLEIRECFYTGPGKADEKAQKRAVEKVSVWMQRGNCPHSVESTAILLSARMNDVPANSNYCVRAAYSAAFSRFVTGILDSHQSRSKKQSMYSLAKTLSPPLPPTFVELRHQATHETLPSLPKLRLATTKALSWIWDYYWSNLSPSLPSLLLSYLTTHSTDTTLETELEKYSDATILDALAELEQRETDAAFLLASTKLKRKLLANTDVRSEASSRGEEGQKSVEDMMADLAQMQQYISSDESSDSEEIEPEPEPAKGKAWQKWQGPWIPTPIGTIC